jgi:hypothetical protein
MGFGRRRSRVLKQFDFDYGNITAKDYGKGLLMFAASKPWAQLQRVMQKGMNDSAYQES